MKKFIITLIAAIVLLTGLFTTYNKYKKVQAENTRLQNNIEFYSAQGTENIVLQSTIQELQRSKDSLIQNIDSVRQLLDIKPKNIKTIVYNETVLHDTIHDSIPITLNFQKTVKPNAQTMIEVIRQDTMLTVIPTIRNNQTLFIHTESKYKYKGFFNRLVHLNFGKIHTDKYEIDNSNDLISVDQTRVINVVK